ncbi:site-specific DNA-methyltransferase [Limnothrix redekei LRLZ20PSL1]|uniref:Methyltransferase n=1 Tax=Limnothrix redekei LRLZ20PSL1 TaxID=3112953 RepID=A0ABW7C571_9CYAN
MSEPSVAVQPFYQRDRCTLYQGDCLEILPLFPANSVDLIFADPPYNLSNNGFTCHGGRAVSVNKGDWDRSNGIEQDFEFHRAWIQECRRILKPNGTIWISGTYHNIYACGFALQCLDFHVLNEICWYKPNASPNLSCRFFTASHETLIWARKSKKGKHVFNYEAMKLGDFPRDPLKLSGRQMRSVWSIPTPPASEKLQGKHPTQKPLDLLDRIISASTNPGDLVLDPFSGSGTTGLSALRVDRVFIGIEKEAAYLQLAVDRFTTAPLPGSETSEDNHVLANGKSSSQPGQQPSHQPDNQTNSKASSKANNSASSQTKTGSQPAGASVMEPSNSPSSYPSPPNHPNH